MLTLNKKNVLLALVSCLPAMVFAAEKAEPQKAAALLNPVLISLVALSIVLLFAIGILAYVLKNLAFAYRNKMRQERSKTATGAVLTLMAILLPAAACFAATESAEAAPVAAPTVIAGLQAVEFYFLLGIIALELIITVVLVLFVKSTVNVLIANPALAASQEAKAALKKLQRVPFWDRLNKSAAIEKEADIMLDHDYDGIKELDNSLPPWWKYGFYFTILVSVVYIWYYHAGGNGPSSHDEYLAEVQAGEEAKAEYLAKSANNVDENTVKMGDAASIDAGANIFQASCAACHAKDGGGGVGPNLADDYWLHGGSMSDVFKSIKYGWPDKGMKSWKDDFSPKQLADLTSYIKSLKGSKPAAPKEKQGDLYVEGTDNAKENAAAPLAVQ